MSTTGNEDEQPGVNAPDRGDAGGAQDTPGADDAQREPDAPSLPGYAEPQGDGEPAPSDDAGAPPADPGSEPSEPLAAESQEPSHRAEGIGVIDDDVPRQAGTSTDAEAKASSDHHGQDEGRETLTAGEAQRAMSGEQAQRLPAMSQNNAPQVDKVAGIVAQTRQDVGTHPRDQIVHVLRQRLEQSGIDLPDDEVEELVDQITVGD